MNDVDAEARGARPRTYTADRCYTRPMPMPLEIIGLGKREVRFVWDEGVEETFPASDPVSVKITK